MSRPFTVSVGLSLFVYSHCLFLTMRACVSACLCLFLCLHVVLSVRVAVLALPVSMPVCAPVTVQFLSPDEAEDLVKNKKALLIDVREEYEFAEVLYICISYIIILHNHISI